MIEDKFDSLAAFVAKAADGHCNLPDQSRASRNSEHDRWAGGSFRTCVNLARSGWIDGAIRIEKMAAPLLEKVSAHMRKPEMVFDIEGDSIDMGAYMTGNPEPFLRWSDTEVLAERRGKFVHVVCNISASCGFTTNQLFAKGAAVSVLVDALEMTGHRVTIDVVQMVGPSGYGYGRDRYGDNSEYMLTVRIKNPDDPLNLESVAFACAHSGMLRRLVFSVEEQQTASVISCFGFSEMGGYGKPEDPVRKIECDIYVGASNSEMIKDPMGWAKRQLLAQGVEFND